MCDQVPGHLGFVSWAGAVSPSPMKSSPMESGFRVRGHTSQGGSQLLPSGAGCPNGDGPSLLPGMSPRETHGLKADCAPHPNQAPEVGSPRSR